MADGLAPHLASTLGLPPPALIDDRLLTTSPETVKDKRAAIIRYIWGESGFPRAKPETISTNVPSPVKDLKNAASVEAFKIRMEAEQENITYHFIPKRKNGQLVVLQHGHACTFDDAREPQGYGMANALDVLLGEGFGVLAAYMPHMRPGDCRTVPHGEMFDLAVKSGSPLKFFLEPVAISLNALKRRYKEVHMAGLSGGGWTTTLYPQSTRVSAAAFRLRAASRCISGQAAP